MGIMMLVWLLVLVALGLVAFRIAARGLPPPAPPDQDRRLAEQAERIEALEDELRRVKEQADFTERLLSERSGPPPHDAPESDRTG